jgi:short-subunit dehydrogenase
MSTALVTGASTGIGLSFARILATRGHDLVIVARHRDRLEALAIELAAMSSTPISVEVLAADLAAPEQLQRVVDRLSDVTRPVDICVNNAGMGVREPFGRSAVEDEQLMIDVMVTAVMRLSHAIVPGMVARGTGAIINVSSIAGWMPTGTYSAIKAWATTFSESLHNEVKQDGVSVIAVCPGYTRTEFHQRAGMTMSSVPSWMWLDADEVVAQALKDARKGKSWSVAGRKYKAMGWAARVLPRSVVAKVTAAR